MPLNAVTALLGASGCRLDDPAPGATCRQLSAANPWISLAPTLATEGLSIGYRQRRRQTLVAADMNLQLWPGDLICLLGPNGAGKSTLMRTIAGMQPPLAGRILLNGNDIQKLKSEAIARQLSVVLTEKVDTGLLPAYGVVALGRYPYTDWQGRADAT